MAKDSTHRQPCAATIAAAPGHLCLVGTPDRCAAAVAAG